MSNRDEKLRDGIRVVKTATEFMAAVKAEDVVTYEIEPGHWLRSDVKGPPDPLAQAPGSRRG